MNIDQLISKLMEWREQLDGSVTVVVADVEATRIRYEEKNDAIVIE